MNTFDIKMLRTQNEIATAIHSCSDSFFNQSINNDNNLNKLVEKFYRYAIVYAAYLEEKIVGFIAFYCNDESTYIAYLSVIVVQKEYHNLGIGTKLLNTMTNYCKSKNFKSIQLEVSKANSNAIALYKRLGFRLCGSASSESDFFELIL